MYCTRCGKENNNGEKYCISCGEKLEELNQQNSAIYDNLNYQNNQNVNDSNNNIQYNTINENTFLTNQKSRKTNIAFIFGIVTILFSFILNIFIIPLAIVGLVLGISDKENSKKKFTTIVLNSGSIIIAIIMFLFSGLSLNDSIKIYYGTGYEFNYNSNWSLTELQGGQEALQYKHKGMYFVPIGTSELSRNINCDFDESSCQESLYNSFYDVWEKQMSTNSLFLYKNSHLFDKLKDNIYYAVFDYGKTSSDLKGKYYILVSKEKNIVISFMSNSSEKDKLEVLNEEILKILEDINITSISNETTDSDTNAIDDDLYDTLDNLSNWNRYSDLRNVTLGKIKNINGGWRILEDSEEYWEFKDGKFWWYQSVNNLNDNYWYGTTQIVKGKSGLKLMGLNENSVDSIISQSDGSVTADDIYAIVFKPTKIISGGIDKSSTNIPKDYTWKYVWILINHDNEGIEAQVLNVDSSEITYYVKIKD